MLHPYPSVASLGATPSSAAWREGHGNVVMLCRYRKPPKSSAILTEIFNRSVAGCTTGLLRLGHHIFLAFSSIRTFIPSLLAPSGPPPKQKHQSTIHKKSQTPSQSEKILLMSRSISLPIFFSCPVVLVWDMPLMKTRLRSVHSTRWALALSDLGSC